MEDIAFLIKEEYESTDSDGNIIRRRTPKKVLCNVRSVTRNEFYQAATQDLRPDITITISNKIDYDDEKLIVHDFELYDVIRAYWSGDEVELTCQKRIGETLRRDGYLVLPDGCRLEMPNAETLLINY